MLRFDSSSTRHLLLCVDDEVPALTLRKAVLEKTGYDVITATTYAEALSELETHPNVSALITDHLLGRDSGVELSAEVKRRYPKMPVILLAGAAPDHLGSVDCFIQKGEPLSYVLDLLGDILHRSEQ